MARECVYDHDDLLRRAMAMFWERGFARTSVEDVVQATGVSRSSLYAAFPNKDALFLAALEHYLETVTRSKLERLARGDNAARAVRRFLLDVAGEGLAADPGHGCLLTNTAVEVGAHQEQVAERIRRALGRLEQALAARLSEAQQQGTLSTGTDPRQFARQLVALVQGLRVMTRLGAEPRMMRDAVRSALAPLDQAHGTDAA